MSEIILSIETTSSPTSVSLLQGTQLLDQHFIDTPQQTSALLSQYMQDLINKHLSSATAIDKIAVSIGPGSFTGLRAGVSAAKGLSFAIKKPLIAVDTLYAIYKKFLNEYGKKYDYYVPLIDARKGKAFMAVYNSSGNQITSNQLVYLEDMDIENLKSNVVLLSLNNKFYDLHLQSRFDTQIVQLNSLQIGLVANEFNEAFDEQKIAYLEPSYLVNNYTKK